jgi:hypothetical protein
MWQPYGSGFMFPARNSVVLCRGVAHWCFPYLQHEGFTRYYTYEVSVDTGHASLMELSIPTDQLARAFCHSYVALYVTNDESLSLLCMYKEGGIRWIDMWKRREDIDSRAWIRTRVVELKPPRQDWSPSFINMWLGKKSGILLIVDEFWCVHTVNIETGSMEEEKFPNGLCRHVPMEIDLSALFTSRLS